jgi:large subunit ribosomal protein L23
MEPTAVIRKPLVTEKSTFGSSELNRYAFEVDRHATKLQIRKAVESIYGVRVVSIATQNRKGESRRFRYGMVTTPTVKRAIVRIHPEDKIELF